MVSFTLDFMIHVGYSNQKATHDQETRRQDGSVLLLIIGMLLPYNLRRRREGLRRLHLLDCVKCATGYPKIPSRYPGQNTMSFLHYCLHTAHKVTLSHLNAKHISWSWLTPYNKNEQSCSRSWQESTILGCVVEDRYDCDVLIKSKSEQRQHNS